MAGGDTVWYYVLSGLFFLPILALISTQPGSILCRAPGPWLLFTSAGQGAALVVGAVAVAA